MEREPFDPADFERLRDSVPWISQVYAHVSLASTNEEAARLARDGAPDGTVVVADYQTAGRGRLDRSWTAEPGTSLLVSWIARPAITRDDFPLLTLATAAAAAEAIERESGVTVDVKWPNDLLARGRKIAGILAEAVNGAAVIGLGLNVRQSEFPDEIAATATSLLRERSRPVGRARLLGVILNAFEPFAAAPRSALESYRARCDTIGKEVRVERPDEEPLTGRALRVADDGSLIVEAGGMETAVAAGDIVHLRV
ncbi:MAG TPA: biotin--[acetyl-CoA-carboxylase] ligase [Actinomycetota bacterium]|nr:biotin--[acetyl-CoA-carboxylase] ligase [Actinomycetota bacterium]